MAKKGDLVIENIKSAMRENAYIHDTSHVGISLKSTGSFFKKTEIVTLTGRVNKEKEYSEIEKILEENCKDIPFENNLRVESR